MFTQDFKADFYNHLIGKRILIIVNYDIDAICASKILQALFKYDHVIYTVVSIMGVAGLQRAYSEHQEDVKFVLLINCGGCVDIVGLLNPAEDVTFYVCDAHRPLDVCNIYSERQICILGDLSLEENIPPFATIFHDSKNDSDNGSSDENNTRENDDCNDSAADTSDVSDTEITDGNVRPPAHKMNRMEKLQQITLKQRALRQWQMERDRIMFEYSQFSYYGRSSALIIFELAWKLSKDNMDLLWLAIVGITEQLLLGKIESSIYTLEIERIQSHVSRLSNKVNDRHNVNASKIVFENDVHLVLYRHWTVHDSIRYSKYPACKLKLWTLRGDKKLHELLLEMGLPLIHARQRFSSMDLLLRKEFFSMLEKLAEKYDIPDIVYGSFTLYYGYSNRYAAADYVYALLAILENMKPDKMPESCFLEALDCLSRKHKSLLNAGIEQAKLIHSTIFKQVQSSLESHLVNSTGTFYYFVLNDPHAFFSYPYALTLLAKFILNAHVATSRSRKSQNLPLIASCPVDSTRNMCLLVGIPPVREDSPKNLFGKAFEQAAFRSKILILTDFFEPSIVQVKQSELGRFLDALTIVLS